MRLLFPSWAFFDEAAAPPTLEVRRASDVGDDGPWTAVVRAMPRRWWQLLFNPEGTRTLAAQTLVERLYLAIANGEAESDDAITTRALVENLAETAAVHALRSGADEGLQWRIVVRTGAAEHIVTVGEVSA